MSYDMDIFSGYMMNYNSLHDVVPNEFKALEESVGEVMTYLKLREIEVNKHDLIIYMQDVRTKYRIDELDDEDFEVLELKLKQPFNDLCKAFSDKTELSIWFYYSGTYNEMYVRFNNEEVVEFTPKAKTLQQMTSGFYYDEWIEEG